MKYYDVYREQTSRDDRGNIRVSYEPTGDRIRGRFVDKITRLMIDETGFSELFTKVLIVQKNYRNKIEIGDKIDGYKVENKMENNSHTVYILGKRG